MEQLKSMGIESFENDGSVYAETSVKGEYVQISTAEVYWRADELLNRK